MPVFRSGIGLAPAWCTLEYLGIADQRRGHLWEYRHGKAEPMPERI